MEDRSKKASRMHPCSLRAVLDSFTGSLVFSPIHLPIHLSSMCLSICPSTHTFITTPCSIAHVFLSINYRSTHLPVHPYAHSSVHPLINLSIYPPLVHPTSIPKSIYPSIYSLFTHLNYLLPIHPPLVYLLIPHSSLHHASHPLHLFFPHPFILHAVTPTLQCTILL